VPSPLGYGSINVYVAKPKSGTPKLPGVMVVHENRGLNPHIEDVARRLALEGYVAFAPDALTPLGGYPGDEDRARALFAQLDQTKTRQDFLAAADVLQKRPDGSGRIGVEGLCYGGGIAHMLATQRPELAAAVTFYGNFPPVEDAAKLKAPLLIHFADVDERINAAWPAYA
jgi:carboxymethylenebutenolidase